MSYCVYCHVNKQNNKRYVGITKQNPERRWNNGRGYIGSPHFYAAIKKYGWEEFTHEILFTNLSKKEAEEKEIYLIAKWNLQDKSKGYNVCAGGNVNTVIGRKHSDETKRKISESEKGKKVSKETIKKLRTSHLNQGVKKVAMMSKEGEVLRCFNSITEASSYLGKNIAAHISACCKSKRRTAGGYKWKYV